MADNGVQYAIKNIGNIYIVNDCIYDHKMVCLNYTTYNMHHNYNIVGVSRYSNVIAVSKSFDPSSHSSEDGHPFAYTCILDIYHADITHSLLGFPKSTAHTMECLFV